jgi:hypothetical protein
MAKIAPMTAAEFWTVLESSVEGGWDAKELHNLLSYYLRVDLKKQGASPLEIVRSYRTWYEFPTNSFDETLPAHMRRQAPDKELWDLVMSFRTIPAFKVAAREFRRARLSGLEAGKSADSGEQA